MIRRILVPVDNSPASLAALHVASEVSRLARATLVGVYVADGRRFSHLSLGQALASSVGLAPPIPSPLPPDQLDKVQLEIEEEIKTASGHFYDHCHRARIRGQFQSRSGIPHEEIATVARTVDMIVMGNRGAHIGVEFAEAGSTIAAVLRESTRPTLIVPESAAGAERMLIAYDGTAPSERALRCGAELASLTEIKDVHVITVTYEENEAAAIGNSVGEYLRAYEREVTFVAKPGNPTTEILNYAHEIEATILVMGAFHLGELSGAVLGSNTQSVLKSADVAVLLVP